MILTIIAIIHILVAIALILIVLLRRAGDLRSAPLLVADQARHCLAVQDRPSL